MNGSAVNTSTLIYPLQERTHNEVIAETLVACVLFILGVTGNGLVCYVIYKKRFTNSSMYFFMLNLAFADLLVCFASIPLTLLSTRPQPVAVTFGSVGCRTIRFVQYMLPPASVAILTATAIDRYFHICIPLKRIITTRSTKQLAALSWGFAIVLTSPIFFLIETVNVSYKGQVYQFCNIEETSSHPIAGTVYLVFRGALGFAIPLAVVSILYFRIVQTVWQRKNNHQSTNKQRANIVKSLLTVVVAFSMSWTPFSVCNKYYLFKPEGNLITRAEIITFWVGLSASVYNPVIYAFYNKKFRDAFVAVIFGRKRSTSNDAAVIEAAKNRPRSKTLPALLAIETQEHHDNMLFIEQRTSACNSANVKTRHLSLGCQPLYEETILLDNHTRRKDDNRIYLAKQQLVKHNREIVIEKLHNDQLTLDRSKTNRGTIDESEDDVFEPPTRHDIKKRQKRKIALPYLLPRLPENTHHPPALQRSQTFQARNDVISGRNRSSPVNQMTSTDVTRKLYFSRYAVSRGRGKPLSRSMSVSETRTMNGRQRDVLYYDNHASRL